MGDTEKNLKTPAMLFATLIVHYPNSCHMNIFVNRSYGGKDDQLCNLRYLFGPVWEDFNLIRYYFVIEPR